MSDWASRFRLAVIVLAAVVLAVSLPGCAARTKADRAEKAERDAEMRRPQGAWPLRDYADYQTDDVTLHFDGRKITVDVAPLAAYAEAADKIDALLPGLRPHYIFIEGRQPNAFAFWRYGRPVVAVNLGMLKLLGDDAAEWAAVVGHEVAHLHLRHQDQRREREDSSKTTTGILVAALMVLGIPFGPALADTAMTANDRGYSRDEEMEADTVGMELMRRAGYQPEAALRFQEKMASVSKGRGPMFFSTHPGWEERVANMRKSIPQPTTQPAPASR